MRSQRGQAMVLAVLCLGVIMAAIVFFGSNRERDASKSTARMEQSQAAYEALAEAAKRVQTMYANEAACAPESLTTRIDNLPNLPATASNLTFGSTTQSLTYVVANPGASALADRQNRCSGGTAGCRQFGIPIDNFVYIVTVGGIYTDGSTSRTGQDCPRDAAFTLSTVVNGTRFFQNVTLTNICTLASCGSGSPASFSSYTSGAPITLTNVTNASTSACTTPYNVISARHYGGGFVESTTTYLTSDDLRWARKYLETGGEDVGETNFLYATGALPAASTANKSGNGACPVSGGDLSNGQCADKPCFPFFDLNRDGKNNEEDLAILENFMRGYLTTLPVNDGLQ